MSCSSIQSEYEKILNPNNVDEETGTRLDYKFLKKKKHKYFSKTIGETTRITRSLETIIERVTTIPTYPPDIIVSDPEGEIIEYHTFDIPVVMVEAREVANVEDKKHKLEDDDNFSDGSNIDPDESMEGIETTATKAWSISSYVDLDENGKVIDQLNITPSEKRIPNIEDETNSSSFSKSTKQILVAGKKKVKQFGAKCKELKFSNSNQFHFSRNLVQNKEMLRKEDFTYKQEMVFSSVKSDEEEEAMFSVQKQEIESESDKEHSVDLLGNENNEIEEFLDKEEDATNKMLNDSLADIVLNCKDLDHKILQTKRKLKQIWRIFGKQKLRDELLKYEQTRRNYGEVFDEMSTIIEKRGDASTHF